MLRKRFRNAIGSLIRSIDMQKDQILQSYGPLVLNRKKHDQPLFTIHPDINPDDARLFTTVHSLRTSLPQAISLTPVSARCLKDKVASGYYILMCSVLDRIGGQRLHWDKRQYEESIRVLSRDMRRFNRKKRAFINREHRDLERKTEDGGKVFVAAPKTGINWFKPGE